MNPLHGERGKRYHSLHCATKDCRQLMYVAECDLSGTRAPIEALYGMLVRCFSCTRETEIGPRGMGVTEVR